MIIDDDNDDDDDDDDYDDDDELNLTITALVKLILSFVLSSVPSESPPNTIIKVTSSSTIEVSWKPINQAHVHGILLGYEVRYAKSDEIPLSWVIKTLDADAQKTVLRGVAKFTPYKVVICAKTSKGCGKEYSTFAHSWDDGELDTNGLSYGEVPYSRTSIKQSPIKRSTYIWRPYFFPLAFV